MSRGEQTTQDAATLQPMPNVLEEPANTGPEEGGDTDVDNCGDEQDNGYSEEFERKDEAIQVQNCYDGLEEDIVKNKFTKSKFYHGLGQIWLKHSPTKLNYWHYELKLENSESQLIKDAKYKSVDDAEKKNMKQSFIEYVWDNYLYKHFWVDMNPCKADLEMSNFHDGRVCFARRWAASYLTKCLFGMVPIVVR